MRILTSLLAGGLAGTMVFAVLLSSPRRGEALGRVPVLETQSEQQGQLVFMEHCHQCHPLGDGGLGPALNNKPAPPALIKFQVRRGLGAMPAFPPETIGEEELNNLTDYLVALRRAT